MDELLRSGGSKHNHSNASNMAQLMENKHLAVDSIAVDGSQLNSLSF